ncbi:MAG TPA: dihydroorotate dehydrogenase electron transfer subunit [bacterium]|nr:dihydroorotate dehydrogenase electron transfer subunit [bacterium]HPN43602.1 dihydroorotate dehydrogenase electron transfer subunit [bacterium]
MKTLKKAVVVPVLANVQVTHDTWHITLEDKQIAHDSCGGQFVNVFVPQNNGVLWRRPFGIHTTDPDKGVFTLLYKQIGRGTTALTTVKAGEALDILGPLGNCFTHTSDLKEAIIVAGGIGIAPFPLFIQHLVQHSVKISVFYGARSKIDFCCLDFFRQTGVNLHLATEDGSSGHKGFITAPLLAYLQTLPDKPGARIYVCGPTPMLAKMKELCRDTGVPAEVSVETMMGCGFGACMGCPVPLENPASDGRLYALACKDGPVFNLEEIRFDE